jgi:hypothetical protein
MHKPTWNAILDFLAKNRSSIAGFYFGGDQMDNQEISHHTAGKPLLRTPGSYKKNTTNFNELILEPLDRLLDKDAKKVWQTGNHDDWEAQLVERQPELQGTVERPILLDLEKRGWRVLPIGDHFQLGKLTLLHGEVLSGIGNQTSNYHAKRAVETYCSSVVYGHLHSPQSYTKILPHNRTDKWQAWCAPIAGATNPGYLHNRPTAWLNGLMIIELHEPTNKNSNFNVYSVVVSDGKFCFAGKTYGA